MKIQTLSNGNVRLSYFEMGEDGEVMEVSRDFFVNGHYIFEWSEDGEDTQQVCEALDDTGSTLMCRNPANLPSIIRRAYEAMKRSRNSDREEDREWEADRTGKWPVFEGDILSSRHPLVKALKASS